MTWDEIAQRHQTDKAARHGIGQGHDYLPRYEEELAGRRVGRLLEIGVDTGASLRMWAEIFPDALVVGVDRRPECAAEAGDRIEVVTASAEDPEAMNSLGSRLGPFDVVVDDGSHIQEDVLAAFDVLWPFLAPDGTYFVEDLLWPEAAWLVHQLALRSIRTVRVMPDTGERTLIVVRR